jgi:hypothetical protein
MKSVARARFGPTRARANQGSRPSPATGPERSRRRDDKETSDFCRLTLRFRAEPGLQPADTFLSRCHWQFLNRERRAEFSHHPKLSTRASRDRLRTGSGLASRRLEKNRAQELGATVRMGADWTIRTGRRSGWSPGVLPVPTNLTAHFDSSFHAASGFPALHHG